MARIDMSHVNLEASTGGHGRWCSTVVAVKRVVIDADEGSCSC